MKARIVIMAVAVVLTLMAGSVAEGAEKVVPGPKGGRLLESKPTRAEFFVNSERKVEVTFYDENLKPVPAAEQVVNVTVEMKPSRTKLEFERKGEILVSNASLPEGNDYTIVVQIRAKQDEKPQNFRIPFHDGVCGSCKWAEYACTCVGSGDEHGHGH